MNLRRAMAMAIATSTLTLRYDPEETLSTADVVTFNAPPSSGAAFERPRRPAPPGSGPRDRWGRLKR